MHSNIRHGLIGATIAGAAVAVLIAGCSNKPEHVDKVKVATPMSTFVITGTPVGKCGPGVKGVTTIIRLKIHDSFDGIFDPKVERRVKFTTTVKPDSDSDSDDTEYRNSTLDMWSEPTATDEVVPYSVDLTTITPTPSAWVELKILIKHADDSNIKFYESPSPTGPQGITVNNPALDTTDICYKDINHDNGDASHPRRVMTVFIHYPQQHSTMPEYGFNIILVPEKGAISTPVIIDPKVLNMG